MRTSRRDAVSDQQERRCENHNKARFLLPGQEVITPFVRVRQSTVGALRVYTVSTGHLSAQGLSAVGTVGTVGTVADDIVDMHHEPRHPKAVSALSALSDDILCRL